MRDLGAHIREIYKNSTKTSRFYKTICLPNWPLLIFLSYIASQISNFWMKIFTKPILLSTNHQTSPFSTNWCHCHYYYYFFNILGSHNTKFELTYSKKLFKTNKFWVKMKQKTTHKCNMYLYHLSSGDKDLWFLTLDYATLSVSTYDFSVGEAPCIYAKSHSEMVNNNICKIKVIIKRLKNKKHTAIVLLYNCVLAHAYSTKYPYTPY